jgi:hypothetical protein
MGEKEKDADGKDNGRERGRKNLRTSEKKI